MKLYKRKPTVHEAFQLEERFLNWSQAAHDALTKNIIIAHNMGKFRDNSETYVEILTLEGPMRCNLGDWIVRDIEGNFYPVKDSIFRETYEEVNKGETNAKEET